MRRNAELINSYASGISTMKPVFNSVSEQKDKVKELIQANRDLFFEYYKTQSIIAFTNLTTFVRINGLKFSISELVRLNQDARRLNMKNRTRLGSNERDEDSSALSLLFKSYNNMNTDAANRTGVQNIGQKDGPEIVLYFDEKSKQKDLHLFHELIDTIQGQLETINAVTPVVEDVPTRPETQV